MILFTTRACRIGGTCKTWVPALERDYPGLQIVYDYIVPLELREMAADALARWCVQDGIDRDGPWVYDEGKKRIGFPSEDGEGMVWR